MSWNVQNGPSKLDKYEWESSEREREDTLTDTVAPGDINVRPSDIDMAVTLAPATTGIQSGQQEWSYQNAPDSEGWYHFGFVEN